MSVSIDCLSFDFDKCVLENTDPELLLRNKASRIPYTRPSLFCVWNYPEASTVGGGGGD
jgi:hypothetical protein